MNFLRNYLNKIKPNFEPEGKLHAFRSLFDGFETFLFVPNDTAKTGVNIHDAIDSKRIMSMVVIALMPAMLFGMYNIGYQNYLAAGTLESAGFFEIFQFRHLLICIFTRRSHCTVITVSNRKVTCKLNPSPACKQARSVSVDDLNSPHRLLRKVLCHYFVRSFLFQTYIFGTKLRNKARFST